MTIKATLRKVLRISVIMRTYIPRTGNICTLDKKLSQEIVMHTTPISHCHPNLNPVTSLHELKSTTNMTVRGNTIMDRLFSKCLIYDLGLDIKYRSSFKIIIPTVTYAPNWATCF